MDASIETIVERLRMLLVEIRFVTIKPKSK
jgi:hypothetical protein